MKSLLIQALAGISAIAICAGTVLGLASASASFSIIDPSTDRFISYKEDTPMVSAWYNEEISKKPYTNSMEKCGYKYDTVLGRYNYAIEIIDGPTHEVLDKSFNQSAYQGEVDWVNNLEWTVDSKPIVISDPNKRPEDGKPSNSALATKPVTENIDGFIETYLQAFSKVGKEAAGVLVLPGFLHVDPLSAFLKKEGDKPSGGMILIDGVISNPIAPGEIGYDSSFGKNTASVMFRTDQAAFMAGIATCMFLEENYDTYKSNGLRVGTYGGIAIPTVTIFMGGLEQGVWFYNQNILPIIAESEYPDQIEEQDKYKIDHQVDMINLGELNSYFTGGFTIGDGRLVSQTLLAMGADAIMPVAGPQTIDTVSEIKNQNSPSIVIGVDTAQELSDMNAKSSYTDKSGNSDIIKFSAEKNISGITSQILDLAAQGVTEPTTSGVGAFGFMTVGSIENNGVKLSESGQKYLISAASIFANKSIGSYTEAVEAFKKSIKDIDNSMVFKY